MAFKALTLNTPPEQAAHILAEDDAAIYEALMGDDRVLDIGNKLAATVITNNSVRISDGVAVVGGHVGRIIKGDYEDMTIENGASGKKRNDIICARFISNGNMDTYRLIVIKGASGTTAVDPTIVSGNLYNGDKQRDFPLWRVCLDGLSITKVEQMFTISATNKFLADKTASLQTSVNQLNSNYNDLNQYSERDLVEYKLTRLGNVKQFIYNTRIPKEWKANTRFAMNTAAFAVEYRPKATFGTAAVITGTGVVALMDFDADGFIYIKPITTIAVGTWVTIHVCYI